MLWQQNINQETPFHFVNKLIKFHGQSSSQPGFMAGAKFPHLGRIHGPNKPGEVGLVLVPLI